MKNNLIVGVLVGLLSLGAAITVVVSFRVVTAKREWKRHQPRILMINNDRIAAQNLFNELVEYSKTHPSVKPLLIQLSSRTNAIAQPPSR
jgi:hypothetical protein